MIFCSKTLLDVRTGSTTGSLPMVAICHATEKELKGNQLSVKKHLEITKQKNLFLSLFSPAERHMLLGSVVTITDS